MVHWRSHQVLDSLSVCASGLCLAHCLALPLLAALIPALSSVLDLGEGVHVAILAFAIPTSAFALGTGYRFHKEAGPLLLGALGLASMAAGVFFAKGPATETILTVIGSIGLAGAHLRNWRFRSAVAR
jgi:hypothetical protein